jgi:hypothetical protein
MKKNSRLNGAPLSSSRELLHFATALHPKFGCYKTDLHPVAISVCISQSEQASSSFRAGGWAASCKTSSLTIRWLRLIDESPSGSTSTRLSDAKLNATGRDFCQIWCD